LRSGNEAFEVRGGEGMRGEERRGEGVFSYLLKSRV
jgi:hypothetical protein